MKPVEYTFRQPVTIIQVFRNMNVYDKTKRSFEQRKNDIAWKDTIPSDSGFIKNGLLYLPEKIRFAENFYSANLVILEDDNHIISSGQNRSLLLVNSVSFDIFRFVKNAGVIELHLQHSYFGIGLPARPNIKLCHLNAGEPVEVKINGKTESSMSSRRSREFKEQQYIFIHYGYFRSCLLLTEKDVHTNKPIPPKRKLVDMIKPLW